MHTALYLPERLAVTIPLSLRTQLPSPSLLRHLDSLPFRTFSWPRLAILMKDAQAVTNDDQLHNAKGLYDDGAAARVQLECDLEETLADSQAAMSISDPSERKQALAAARLRRHRNVAVWTMLNRTPSSF